ncbi:DUF2064 domain-containing protein, partial [Streptomyces sparsus]
DGCRGPALLVGMDTPQLSAALLAPVCAPDAWSGADAYFGPAADGGFWALALARPDPELVRGVPMSSDRTGAVQRRRLVAAGLRFTDLPRLRAGDIAEDAAEGATATTGRFAAAHARTLKNWTLQTGAS